MNIQANQHLLCRDVTGRLLTLDFTVEKHPLLQEFTCISAPVRIKRPAGKDHYYLVVQLASRGR